MSNPDTREAFKVGLILDIHMWMNDPEATVGDKKVMTGCNFDMLIDRIMTTFDDVNNG